MDARKTKKGRRLNPERENRLRRANSELAEMVDYLVRQEWKGCDVTVADPERWAADLLPGEFLGARDPWELSVTKVGERTFRVVRRREPPPWGSVNERIVAPMMAERWYEEDCGSDPELARTSFLRVRGAFDPEDPESWKRFRMLALLRRSLVGERGDVG